MIERSASLERSTRETQIKLSLNLDGSGEAHLDLGIPFFEHMLEQLAKHARIDLSIQAKGDLEVDAHHTVEDVGIVLGGALRRALADSSGIVRYGCMTVPLDESLSRAVVDLSGRPGLFYRAEYVRQRVGDFDLDLVVEFFQGLVNHAMITVHLDVLKGSNAHHQVESLFKAFARALRQAVAVDPLAPGVPSTKGVL
ncbi:MAG: imidazoleglycerol-phosphate dehydratase HisB [Gammaproteobacteria bacterium AqS3]|nr:imidazoleglycerol-phosphate dehydratase HisB [Gammaproteobacteria bacterium AqS3]